MNLLFLLIPLKILLFPTVLILRLFILLTNPILVILIRGYYYARYFVTLIFNYLIYATTFIFRLLYYAILSFDKRLLLLIIVLFLILGFIFTKKKPEYPYSRF